MLSPQYPIWWVIHLPTGNEYEILFIGNMGKEKQLQQLRHILLETTHLKRSLMLWHRSPVPKVWLDILINRTNIILTRKKQQEKKAENFVHLCGITITEEAIKCLIFAVPNVFRRNHQMNFCLWNTDDKNCQTGDDTQNVRCHDVAVWYSFRYRIALRTKHITCPYGASLYTFSNCTRHLSKLLPLR